MRILKVSGLVVLVLVVVTAVLGIVVPRDYLVVRSVSISAPAEVVFSHVRFWKNWEAWSPWAEKDSTLQATITGEDGAIGSVYAWTGDPDVSGRGEMAVTGVTPNEELRYHLRLLEPWGSESDGHIRIKPAGGGSQVSWAMYGRNPFPWNVAGLFMGMDRMIGPDFERGLGLLKGLAERDAAALARYPAAETEFPGGRYAAVRASVPIQGIKSFFMESLGALQQAIDKARGVRMAGAPVGLYFEWDDKAGTTDLAVGIPVKGVLQTTDIGMIDLPPARAFKVDYYGPYEGMPSAYGSLSTYFHVHDLTFKAPAIEEYVTDPAAEPDTTTWLTRIYFLAE
ncbi:MAG: SRPBCC family protein [Candidatus Eisenbacteria bacterium]|nr:SRPBCC family protein [Candidatus Eisenbacteria bacterium]